MLAIVGDASPQSEITRANMPDVGPEPDESVHQALDELVEHERLAPDLDAAAAVVRAWLAAIVPAGADRMLELAGPLASDLDMLERARAEEKRDPTRAFELAPVLELLRIRFALPEGSALDELLVARPASSESLVHASRLVRELVDESWKPGASRAHRAFRAHLLADADLETQARALAADAPDRLGAARMIVAREPDIARRIASFDSLAETDADGAAKHDAADPIEARVRKRRFTWLHLVLALVVIGLFAWQYFLR